VTAKGLETRTEHVSGPNDVTDVVLSGHDIVKTYGGTKALKGVNFDIRRGRVTTLFGENGAGKSTLMKILSGVEQPSSGEIVLDGEPCTFTSTVDARGRGIAIIHQELSLSPNLNVRDNIFMGRELRTAAGTVDFPREARETKALMDELEEAIDPMTAVSELRLGQQQIVEIARALSINARVLIMDEPTSALSASEVEMLFRVIRDLTARGVSIVYISHHLEEALQVTDHAVVLRDGSITATAEAGDIDLDWVVQQMVGTSFDLGEPPPSSQGGEAALALENIRVRDPRNPARLVVDDVDLQVQVGEVVCIYGLMGAGLKGKDVTGLSIAERIDRGLGLVPEDRQRDGLVPTMTVGRNLSLASIGAFARRAVLSRRAESVLVDDSIRDVHVKTAGSAAAIGSLSGGNQQKVVIGKILATSPRVILLDEPSRGIDIGAKGEVFRLLADRASNGLAVLYSTSEVNECLSIAHRTVVMRRGRIAAEFGTDVTKEMIMGASGEAVVTDHGYERKRSST